MKLTSPGYALTLFFLIFFGVGVTLLVGQQRAMNSILLNERYRILAGFRARATPVLEIAPQKISQFSHADQLVDPRKTLPQAGDYPLKDLAALQAFAELCDPETAALIREPRLRKALIWHERECGIRHELPPHFFRKPPFIHPSGVSFVALALQSEIANFKTKAWAETHTAFSHVTELPLLKRFGAALTSSDLWLSSLPPEALMALLRHDEVIPAGTRLMIRTDGSNYDVYERKDWDAYLARSALLVGEKPALAPCTDLTPSLCWKWDKQAIRVRSARYKEFCLFAVLGLVLGLLGMGLAAVRRRRRERFARVFMLQTLTHELRTPVSTMHFSIEKFRKEFGNLSSGLQDAFIQLCDDIQRLRQLVDSSTRYLQSEENKNAVKFLDREIASLISFLESVLEPYGEEISFVPPAQDFAVHTDPYWLAVCVRNLVENAIRHGVKPISVELGKEAAAATISVVDCGNLDPRTIPGLFRAFRRRDASPGLGLGLGITREIVAQLGGRLIVRGAPYTIFSIEL